MRAVALTEAEDHVCGRYRIRAFAPALAVSGWSLTVRGIARGLLGRLRQLDATRDFDATILQRKLLPTWQLSILRQRARHLIFDFDDAVLYRDSYDPRGPHCPRRRARFGRTVRVADVVIAGNDFLADCALRAGARPERVRVIPTCIDTDAYPVAESAPHTDPDAVELAWIGSSSTLAGLESQRGIWERIGREVPGARLRLICDRFPSFGPLGVVPISWSESTEAAELSRADLGVSWVPDDLWSRGKCGLKILQYGAAGLPTLANPVGVHPEMIRPGQTGFLPTTAEEWIEAVRWLRDRPRERAEMGRAARASVEDGYSVRAWAPTFVGTIAGSGGVPAPRFRGTTASRTVARPSGKRS